MEMSEKDGEAIIGVSPTDSFEAEFENVFLSSANDDVDADAHIDVGSVSGDPLHLLGGGGSGISTSGSLGKTGDDDGSSRNNNKSPTLPLPSPVMLSPSGEGINPTGGSSSVSVYAPSNAVHMEIQENARLPTFNMTVDRSNAVGSGLAMMRGRSNSLGRGRGFSFGSSSSGKPGANVGGSSAAPGGVVSDMTARDVDEIVRLSENDVNLTEMFLGADVRTSASMAYSNAGALLGSIGSRVGERRDNIEALNSTTTKTGTGTGTGPTAADAAATMLAPLSPLAQAALATTDVDTINTAADNGKAADEPQRLPVGRGIAHEIYASRQPVRSSTGGGSKDMMQSPYGRRVPLPIPTPTGNATSGTSIGSSGETAAASALPAMSPDTMAAAVATAAAIANSRPPVPDAASTATPGSATTSANAPSAVTKEATAKKINNSSPTEAKSESTTPPPSPYPYTYPPHPGAPQYPPYHPSQVGSNPYHQAQQAHAAKFAAAHSSSKASLTEAAKKRSQFGFGSNHVVPSVPMPMGKKAGGKDPAAGAMPPHSMHHPHLAAVSRHMSAHAHAAAASAAHKRQAAHVVNNGTNTGPAYERKKQRAKDARVKLNDAIDRLSVAIGLAGTQSTERAQQLSADTMSPPPDPEQFTQCPIRTFRPSVVKNMEDIGKAADAAKKWERPSFVGTAAVMVQGLNAQCEALMRELIEMNRLYREEVAKNGGASSTSANDKADETVEDDKPVDVDVAETAKWRSAALVSEGSNGETSPNVVDAVAWPCKRRRLSPGAADDKLSQTLQTQPIRKPIVSFLDPKSLLQCCQVCSHWGQCSLFGGDEAWNDLVLCRFGFANMRKWQEEDDEGNEKHEPLKLYRRMDEANVRPSCLYEGNVRLGHGSIPGVVGAWVTIVERSNGETLRSVRKQDHNPQSIGSAFTSLPVIELRTLLQNVGAADGPIIVPDQTLTVDASTRRRGEKMSEITWDGRLSKKLISMDGTTTAAVASGEKHAPEMFRLGIFDSRIIVAHVYAKGCSTTTKFRRRANSVKVLVSVKGTTVALVVPFKKNGGDIDDGSSTSSSIREHPVSEIVIK